MSTYHRQFAPDEADGSVDEVKVLTAVTYIKEQLSRETAEDDDPETNADDVVVTTQRGEDQYGRPGVFILGSIDKDQTPHEYGDGSLADEFPVVNI